MMPPPQRHAVAPRVDAPDEVIPPQMVRGPWTLLIYLLHHPRTLLSAGVYLLIFALLLVTVAGGVGWLALTLAGMDPLTVVYSRIKPTRAGLIDFSPLLSGEDSFKWARLEQVEHEVFFVGVALHDTFGGHLATIQRHLQNGRKCRFLIADPEGNHFASNAAMFSGPTELHHQQIEITMSGYIQLREQAATLPGSIELRILDAPFPQACYFFDAADPQATLILVTRLPRIDAPNMPALVFGRMPGGLLDSYYASWDHLWQKSIPFEDWVNTHPEYYK